MPRKPDITAKSQTLSIRLDPKTRFLLEYVSKLKGQSITTVVERAIVSAANDATVPDREFGGELNWQEFWDVTEGIRSLKLARRKEFFPTFEEERRLEFCKAHWPFFFTSESMKNFRPYYVQILWPRIDEFVDLHERTQAENYWAATEAMKAALTVAKLGIPEWPPKPAATANAQKPKEPAQATSGNSSRELDDDIPF